MRLIIIEPKGWDGIKYSNPCFYKINNQSMLDFNIRQFGEEKITYLGEKASYVRSKYQKVKVIENNLTHLIGEVYPLLLALKQDKTSTFITTSCAYVNSLIIDSMRDVNCELVNGDQNSIGIYHFDGELNRSIVKNFDGNYHQSVSNILKSNSAIKRASFREEEIIKHSTSDEYLKLFKRITDTSFEELTSLNAEKLLAFYLEQPIETKEYYKPHSFELEDLKKIANGPNIYLLAFRNGKVIGYGSLQGLEFQGPASFGFIVDEQEKRSGLAFSLGIALIQKAKKLGLEAIIANISVTNYAAIKLCRRLGFGFKLVKKSRIYALIDFYERRIEIPVHYIEKTSNKKETATW